MLSILKNKIYNFINWFLNPIFNLIANKISLLHYIHGDRKRLILGDNIGLVNTVFNTASGNILIEFDILQHPPTGNSVDQSYTRSPDLTGDFVQHGTVSANLFSPGTKADGSSF